MKKSTFASQYDPTTVGSGGLPECPAIMGFKDLLISDIMIYCLSPMVSGDTHIYGIMSVVLFIC